MDKKESKDREVSHRIVLSSEKKKNSDKTSIQGIIIQVQHKK
jgi:hypothetical protein